MAFVTRPGNVTLKPDAASLDKAVSAFSHHLCNDMAYLASTLELAALSVSNPDTAASLVAAQRHVINICDKVRAVASAIRTPQDSDYRYTSLATVLHTGCAQAAESLSSGAMPATRVEVEAAPNLRALVYPTLLQDAVAALVVNSFEAEADAITVSAQAQGDVITVSVKDSGWGINLEQLDTIMDPFITTKAPPHWGLGLTIAQLAAAHHRGSITVASSGQGAGTQVTLICAVPSRLG